MSQETRSHSWRMQKNGSQSCSMMSRMQRVQPAAKRIDICSQTSRSQSGHSSIVSRLDFYFCQGQYTHTQTRHCQPAKLGWVGWFVWSLGTNGRTAFLFYSYVEKQATWPNWECCQRVNLKEGYEETKYSWQREIIKTIGQTIIHGGRSESIIPSQKTQ